MPAGYTEHSAAILSEITNFYKVHQLHIASRDRLEGFRKMAKLTVVFLTLLVSFGLLDTVKTEEDAEHERSGSPEEGEDRAAYAHASISVRPGLPYRPLPLGKHGSSPPPPGSRPGLIQCYACVDCPQVYLNTTAKWCPRALDPTKHLSCVTYAEQYKHLKKAWYIRGCASERGSCADIKHSHSSHSDVVRLISCDECEGDKCNGASRSLTDLTMAAIALLVTPLLAKVTTT